MNNTALFFCGTALSPAARLPSSQKGRYRNPLGHRPSDCIFSLVQLMLRMLTPSPGSAYGFRSQQKSPSRSPWRSTDRSRRPMRDFSLLPYDFHTVCPAKPCVSEQFGRRSGFRPVSSEGDSCGFHTTLADRQARAGCSTGHFAECIFKLR